MILQNKTIRGILAGALGGFLAWIMSEPVALVILNPYGSVADLLFRDALWGIPVGIGLGLILGAAEGFSLRSTMLTVRGALIGAAIGLVGGMVGVVLAEAVYQQVQWLCLIGRGLGWSIFGLFLGLQEGIRRRSLKGTRNAAIGGWIGGFVGGVLFDIVGAFTSFIGGGTLSRGIALITLGAAIGVLIVLVERVLADGTLVVTLGRFEGREILLDKPTMILGGDEHNDVYLPDKGVVPRHAEIRAEGSGFAIESLNGPVTVNKLAVTRQLLQPGDQVEIGVTRMRYRTRRRDVPVATSAPRPPARLSPAPPAARPELSPASPIAPTTNMCPRCAHLNRAGAKFCQRCGQKL